MEVHDHGQGQAGLNYRRDDRDFIEEKQHPGGNGDGRARRPRRQSEDPLHGFRQQPHFDAELRHRGRKVQVAIGILQAGERA